MDKIKIVDVADIVEKVCTNIKINENMYDDDLSNYGLDSLAFMTLIVLLEEKFQKEIPIEVISFEDFNTVNKIYNLIIEI